MKYQITEGSGTVTVAGRLSRNGSHSVLIPLPAELKARLDKAIEGGSTSAAIVFLLAYSLDQLDKNGHRLLGNGD
jgi:hypothetical protein